MAEIEIRAACEADMDGVATIHKHYIQNTVITFAEEVLPVASYIKGLKDVTADGLPYLVAVEPETSTVLGYANAHGFRAALGAYRHTVEFSLFCDPKQTGRGIGSKLLTTLLEVLRGPAKYPSLSSSAAGVEPREVKQVLACMAVDETGKRKGLALMEFYESFGFTLNGHLRQVGYKFGRWIDTMYLQLSFA